jgi:hypothetical protein
MRHASVGLLMWSCQGSNVAGTPPVARVPPVATVKTRPSASSTAISKVDVTGAIMSARWTTAGSLAFATKTQLYIAEGPNWTVREVSAGGGKLRLLGAGYVDEGTGNLCDYSGTVLAAVEPRAFVFPSLLRKALTRCDANAEHCKTLVSERTGSAWKPVRTFDASDDLDMNSETSPEEALYVRGLGSHVYDVIALSGQAPAVRIASPHNGQLLATPPPCYELGFVVIPSGVGYRKIDALGAVKASRQATLPMPNGIVVSDFDRNSQQLLFQTQMGVALFDLAKDVLVGIYPSPPCDSPENMCTAYIFNGAIVGDGVALDTKAKVWRKTSTPNGTVLARADSGDTLFWHEGACFWLSSGNAATTTPTSFACPLEESALQPAGTNLWLRDHGTLRVVDRNGKTVFSAGTRATPQ